MRRTLCFSLFIPLALSCGGPELDEGSSEARVELAQDEIELVLALVNDPSVSADQLDVDAGLDRRAAFGIVEHRDGPDGLKGTEDDNPFDDIEELDRVPYVGSRALTQLLEYAIARGYPRTGATGEAEAIFSPQAYQNSHNARVAQLIDSAQETIDIAMYSYSDARIGDALAAAVARGVSVRFIFETANEDRKLAGDALSSSASGRLEALGVDVRYVNKIMHHKFLIVDGPRHDLARAQTALLASGSANWSYGAATRYDENTLFLSGQTELALRFQREFDRLWNHSSDFSSQTFTQELSSLEITDELIADDASVHAYFTSQNFSVASNGTSFRIINDQNTISDAMVSAINGAERSIWIASGHLRSRPVAEALMARAAAGDGLDIRIYLDGQEYISSYYHNQQVQELEDCLAAASTGGQLRSCTDRGFYFGYQASLAGIPVRYKYYAYRWHYSYAPQMHHKYMIIDGDEIWTGSYNLSDNAEHNTFENMLVFRGEEFASLVDAYEANFLDIWETNRGVGRYEALLEEIATADTIPLVFAPMALTWEEIGPIKAAIASNCSLINSTPYRTTPEAHRTCPRQ